MKKIYRQLVLAIGAATAMQACYGQLGIALGAGAEQWNRQRELNMQQEQLDMQKRAQDMELEQMRRDDEERRRVFEERKRERARIEFARREAEEAEQQRKRDDAEKCANQRAALASFENEFGAAGIATAKRIRAKMAEQGWPNSCIPALQFSEFLAAIKKVYGQVANEMAFDDAMTKFMSNKKEYKNQANVELFKHEADVISAEVHEGKTVKPKTVDEFFALTHQRTLARLKTTKMTSAR